MEIDTQSIETAKGTPEGTFIVMAEGENIDESIGCELHKEGVLSFIKSFENDKEALAEYMLDSDYTKVTRLYIA